MVATGKRYINDVIGRLPDERLNILLFICLSYLMKEVC